MAIVLHPLVDLSRAWPPFFVNNLLEVYTHGKGKAGLKFQALRSQVVSSLPSAPPPGPATFIAECLEVLQNIGPPHDEGLSHMLISALCQSNRSNWPDEDASIARRLGGSLFCKALVGEFRMDSRIVVKLPIAFHFDLKDIGNILIPGQSEEVLQVNAAKQFVELYLMDLLKRQLYTGAVSLIKNFGLQTCDYQDLIAEIVDDGQANLAIEWAVHLGKDMLKFLVQHCTETGLYKVAYKVVQQHKLEAEFPDAYHLYRQSSLHKLVGKGLWDVAQSIAEGDALLIDYLVILAMKDNDAEKVVELSERFHLDISPLSPDTESSNKSSVYLQLESVVSKDKIYWIDSHEGLQFAERALFGVKLVGIDCEWKPDSVRGASPNKVSILQVASSDLVLVLDLISLLKNCQSSLNTFIGYLFHAPDILKLGYAVHNDLERLSRSFVEIDAFRLCESVLDLQTAFGRQFKGGLSGLAKVFLGSSLNKQTRMSDWEMRPLSKKQLHYAALDAAVLLPIFYSIADYSPATEKLQGWESHVTCYRMLHKWKGDKESVRTTDLPNSDESMIGSHEELVLASCELLGIPIPGLMKAELLEFTRAAKMLPPAYTTASLTSSSKTAFYSTVKVASTMFSGRLAPSKKEAEFWAAHVALTKVSLGSEHLGNCPTTEERHTRALHRACSNTSNFGCSVLLHSLPKICDFTKNWKHTAFNFVPTCIRHFRFMTCV